MIWCLICPVDPVTWVHHSPAPRFLLSEAGLVIRCSVVWDSMPVDQTLWNLSDSGEALEAGKMNSDNNVHSYDNKPLVLLGRKGWVWLTCHRVGMWCYKVIMPHWFLLITNWTFTVCSSQISLDKWVVVGVYGIGVESLLMFHLC